LASNCADHEERDKADKADKANATKCDRLQQEMQVLEEERMAIFWAHGAPEELGFRRI
jgi:hypothetical protein